MLFVSDSFDIAMVHPKNITHLRFEPLTENQVKKMTRDESRVIVGVSDRNLLGVYNGLSGTLNKPQELGRISMCELDVLILLQKRHTAGGTTDKTFFKVTCRKDFEIFDINSVAVILDRDGVVHGRADAITEVPALLDKRNLLNGES